MHVALRRAMSLLQFLVGEERQELRYAFDGFHPVAKTGGTAAHGGTRQRGPGTRLAAHLTYGLPSR
jgi:hypothetical protein